MSATLPISVLRGGGTHSSECPLMMLLLLFIAVHQANYSSGFIARYARSSVSNRIVLKYFFYFLTDSKTTFCVF